MASIFFHVFQIEICSNYPILGYAPFSHPSSGDLGNLGAIGKVCLVVPAMKKAQNCTDLGRARHCVGVVLRGFPLFLSGYVGWFSIVSHF